VHGVLRQVSGVFHLFCALSRLLIAIVYQTWFVRRFFRRNLPFVNTAADGTITPKHKKRMLFYAVLFVANISQGLAILRGKPLSYSERLGSTWFSAFIPLFDDWFDTQSDAPDKDIAKAVLQPQTIFARHDLDRLSLQHMLPALLTHANGRFEKQVTYAIQTQTDSLKQKDVAIPINEIRNLVYNKGGAAVQLVRTMLNGEPTPAQEALYHHIGALIQYMDDCFDVYEDYHDGIQTLCSTCTDIAILQSDFRKEVGHLQLLLEQSGYAPSAQKRWWRTFYLWIAMTEVCLAQWARTQRAHGGAFAPARYARKEIITDMALWRNRWTWFRCYVRGVHG
jgi:hypothetical protein